MRIGTGGALTVTSTEQWLSQLRAARAFLGSASIGPTAANYSHVQLYNPAGSGVQVIVRTAFASVAVAAFVNLGRYDVALTTDQGTGKNSLLGAAAAQAHIRSQDNAARLPTLVAQMYLQAGLPINFASEWLVEISPGQGIVLYPDTVNTEIVAAFSWYEV